MMAMARAAIDEHIATAVAADMTHCHRRECLDLRDHPPQSSSASRLTAGASGCMALPAGARRTRLVHTSHSSAAESTAPSAPAKADNGERFMFSGSNAEIIDDLRAMHELGVKAIDFNFADLTVDAMRQFHDEVVVKS